MTKPELFSPKQIEKLNEIFWLNEIHYSYADLLTKKIKKIKENPDVFKKAEKLAKWGEQYDKMQETCTNPTVNSDIKKHELKLWNQAVYLALAKAINKTPTKKNLRKIAKQLHWAVQEFTWFCKDNEVYYGSHFIRKFTLISPNIIIAAAVLVRAKYPVLWVMVNAEEALDDYIYCVLLRNKANRSYVDGRKIW